MSYICAHCHKKHNRPETAQKCADDNRKIGGYEGAMPDAHYLVDAMDHRNEPAERTVIHVKFKTLTTGRWNGYRLVNVYDADGKAIGLSSPEDRDSIVSMVRKGGGKGFRKAMLRFGVERETCPICYKPLRDLKEKSYGIHTDPLCSQIAFG